MPHPETSDLIHRAVVWPYAKRNRFGTIVLANPVELRCRWVQKSRMATDRNGNPVALEAQVALDRKVRVGSLMWKGELADWDDTLQDEIFEVVFYNEAEDVKGRHTARTVDLKFWKSNLPGAP